MRHRKISSGFCSWSSTTASNSNAGRESVFSYEDVLLSPLVFGETVSFPYFQKGMGKRACLFLCILDRRNDIQNINAFSDSIGTAS